MHETSFTEKSSTSNRFYDFYLGEILPHEVDKYRSSIHIYGDLGQFVIKNTALTQLAHQLGLNRRELLKKEPEELLSMIKSAGNIVFSVFEMEPNIFYVYRVTSDKYVAIPHRELFDFAKTIITEAGVRDVEMSVERYTRRTAAYFTLWSKPLRYSRPGDMLRIILGVSNANTGQHSIKVFGFFEILQCSNGLIHNDFISRIRIYHAAEKTKILARVGEAIKNLLKKLAEKSEEIAKKITRLEEIEVEPWMIDLWLQLQKQKLPKKYHKWFTRTLYDNRRIFGDTAETMFQTLTYFVPRMMTRNEDLAQRLNNEAVKILENPSEYLVKI